MSREVYANCIVINQIKNSKVKFGHGCVGYNRNEAVKKATGEYLAFLDDDDYWLPHKLDLQVSEMLKQNFEFCCTDGLYGRGTYNSEKNYPKYNREYHWKFLSNELGFKDDFPDVWDLNLINRWNLIINSSVVMKKSLYEKAGGMPYKRRGQDYECWKNCLQFADVLYIKTPCMYYDDLHGHGQNH
jgi:glycosyltransferase involved in cell wall biosynthesis